MTFLIFLQDDAIVRRFLQFDFFATFTKRSFVVHTGITFAGYHSLNRLNEGM